MNLKRIVQFALPVVMAFAAAAPSHAAQPAAQPSEKLLTPSNHTLLLIDHQP
jgi:hypothetical protein